MYKEAMICFGDTLILKALLNPLAKNPPKGPITDAKMDMKKAWSKKGYRVTVSFIQSYKETSSLYNQYYRW